MTVQNGRTPKEKRSRSGAGGRGLFAALMLCLIAVGGVAAADFSDRLERPALESDGQDTTTVTSAVTTTTAKPAAVKTAVTTTTTVTAAEETTVTTAASLFCLPLSNKVLTSFSEQPLYNKTLDTYRAHTAVDFDGEQGQSVRPFADGTVCAVEEDALWGGCVTVDHGAGVVTVYRGISPCVEVGDELTADDRLGMLADVPCETDLGPHLHFELYKDGSAADAAALFDGQLVYE